MSIFKRHDQGNAQQSTATLSPAMGAAAGVAQPAELPPTVSPAAAPRQAAAPGVLPPPAAPIYSTRPPEPAPRPYDINRILADHPLDGDGAGVVTTSVGRAKETQVNAQVSVEGERVRLAMHGARATATRAHVAQRTAPQPASLPRVAKPRHPFDPIAAAQAGLLNLAWKWQEAGAPIRAIHTYMELLARYPGSPAASAAVADLVELSSKLAEQGNFHIALSIYDEMEHLQICEEE